MQAKSDRMPVQRWIDAVVSRRHLFVCSVCFMHVVSVQRVVRSASWYSRARVCINRIRTRAHAAATATYTFVTLQGICSQTPGCAALRNGLSLSLISLVTRQIWSSLNLHYTMSFSNIIGNLRYLIYTGGEWIAEFSYYANKTLS
jgi:hypothetical protein